MLSKIKKILIAISEDIHYSLSFLKNYDQDDEVIFSKLRTYAHILDKGVNITPFEKGHGLQIYEKCVALRNKISNQMILSDPAFKWICSVMEYYIEKQTENSVNTSQENNVFCIDPIDKITFYNIIKARTSCRNFLEDKITDQVWDEIIEVALESPSGCCRQPTRFYIEKKPDTIQELKKCIAGATGFSSIIPYLICITADTRAYEIRDRFSPIIDASLCVQNFLLACAANNIASTALNWQHASFKENDKVKDILGIPEYEKIIIFIAAGYPKIIPNKPQRMSLSMVRKK